jgi:beta-galactosidase
VNPRFGASLFLICFLVTSTSSAFKGDRISSPDSVPRIVEARQVNGVRQCSISLNGEWLYSSVPKSDFWRDTSTVGWKPIHVPGEPMMQGFSVKHDIEYAYRKSINIPADFSGKRIFLRFNGVYSQGRVWVNGNYVREHQGGFTSWECDVTPHVVPGGPATLVVGVTDRIDEISFASGYAKHPIGGILRGVELLALPEVHVQELIALVRFDSSYTTATLTVQSTLNQPTRATLEISLTDPSGRVLPLGKPTIVFPESQQKGSIDIRVDSPIHWDAEHPRLYTLQGALTSHGAMTEVISQSIGFRDVRVKGNKLFVNGKPVKLRGACRHDIHPLQGRSTTPEQDKLDVLLAKEANFNFIRTSHYPPSREFLHYCDEFGIYVEEETAICFVGTHRHEPYRSKGASQSDPAFMSRYLSQLKEMVDRDRNHPSVIVWSIGNENEYGSNFQAEYRLVKDIDSSRPVMFSYPGYVPKDSTCYDIVSIHYVSYEGNANQLGVDIKNFGLPFIPVLHDEWAHVACYNTQTLKSDLNVRNFWGESLKRMWDACFDSDDGLGGAIWGYIDETFMLPDTVVGYGPWGIIDTWRRKKPEFWLTKKAYSPLRVELTHYASVDPRKDILVPVYNRFDHTNVNELLIRLSSPSGAATKAIPAPDIPPHSKGFITLHHSVLTGKELKLTILRDGSEIVDEEMLTFDEAQKKPDPTLKQLRIIDGEASVKAIGEGFEIIFSKSTGLIENGSVDGSKVLLAGPYLHLMSSGGAIDWIADSLIDLTGTQWHLLDVRFEPRPGELRVFSHGRAGLIDVQFQVTVTGSGQMLTSYEISQLPDKFREAGVRFVMDKRLTSLDWNRDALWSLYPEDHIGRPTGSATAFVLPVQEEGYRVRPFHAWSMDTRDFYLYGMSGRPRERDFAVPVDFRTTKEHIRSYAVRDPRRQIGVQVISEGTVAARAGVNADSTVTVTVLNAWNYSDLRWGNYEGIRKMPARFAGGVQMQLMLRGTTR